MVIFGKGEVQVRFLPSTLTMWLKGTSDLESKRSAVYCFTNETKSTFVQAFPEALL